MTAIETTQYVAPDTHRVHGSYVKYVIEKCRCTPCTVANCDYERVRKARVEPPYVGADRTRQHLKMLAEHGVGLKSVARITGVSTGLLSKIIYGSKDARGRHREPTRRVRRATEQKVLAVGMQDAPGGTREPAEATWRIVEQLLDRGWTKADIGRAISGPAAKALQLSTNTVSRENARIVAGLLELPVPPRNLGKAGLRLVEPVDNGDDAAPLQVDYHLPSFTLDPSLDESWRERATCRRPDVPTYLFFPGRGDRATLNAARAICARCPVHVECLDWAIRAHQTDGVYGGKTARERRSIRRLAS